MNEKRNMAASIFETAVEFISSAEREQYLNAACGQDQQLRAEVEELLKHDADAGNFLDGRDVSGVAVTSDQQGIRECPGTIIGSFKLLEQIGEGGFGVVYMAEQQQPLRRKVALKIIKAGMDTRQVIARFEAERQALALMNHPNIAQAFDAGETESGRPYFVMELIYGVSITEYCDNHQLTARERLQLFVSVCQAVQHAHQRSIIHRDLKPSNVLVTMHDGAPVVKIIDFGIAKAIGQQLTDKTMFTGFAQMIGTPLYMSPEQAALSGQDVDTRSDIYSLGVLLYELLTGSTPFDKSRLKDAGYDEIRRIIREEEPPRPSARVSTQGRAAATVSAQRKSDPRRLSRLFREELDWIVMKALEKDRTRRYESASTFAQDVLHYLNDEPVIACPPSAWYRFGKFARRHRTMLSTSLLLATALVMGSAISIWQAVRATHAETSADKGWSEEKIARQRADAAEYTAKQQVYRAKVNEAEARQWSGRPGQRFASWAAVTDAARLVDELKHDAAAILALRNLAIASLTRADLHPTETKSHSVAMPFVQLESKWVVRSAENGQLTIESRDKAEKQVCLPVPAFSHASVSPCGRYLLVVVGEKKNRQAQIWDVQRQALLGSQPLAFDAIFRFAWHPHGKALALVDNPKIILWQPTLGNAVQRLEGHQTIVDALAFSHSGCILASAGRDALIKLWDVATGKELVALPAQAQELQFTKDDQWLAFRYSKTVRHVLVATGSELRTLPPQPNGLYSIDVSPDSRWLATVGGDGIRVWDLDFEHEATLVPAKNWLSASFDPVSGLLVARGVAPKRAEARHMVQAADDGSGPPKLTVTSVGMPQHDFYPPGQFVVFEPAESRYRHAATSSDGRWLLKAGWTRGFGPPPKRPTTPDGRPIMAPPPQITLLDRKAGTERMLAGNGEMDLGRHLAMCPDAKLAVGASSKNYYFWHVESGERANVLARKETNTTGPAAFSPEGKMIAVALSQWEIQLLDPETVERFATLRTPQTEPLVWFSFSPDGRRLVAATQVGRIQVWDVRAIRRQLAAIGLDWKLRPWLGKS